MGDEFKAYIQKNALSDKNGATDFKSYIAKHSPKEKETSAGMAALEHYGNQATLGYLPQIQAGVESVTPSPTSSLDSDLAKQGFKISQSAPSYVESRDANLKRLAKQSEEHPGAALAGDVLGVGASALLTSALGKAIQGNQALRASASLGPLTESATKAARIIDPLKRTAEAAKTGAILGAVSNPSDVEGELNPFQIDERLDRAKLGAKTGAIVQGGMEVLGPLAKRASAWYRGKAGEKGTAALGARKADMKKLGEKGAQELGNDALDQGIVVPLSTPASVARKAGAMKEKVGEELGDLISSAEQGGAPKIDGAKLGLDLLDDQAVNAARKTPGAGAMYNSAIQEAEVLAQNGEMTLSQAHALRKRIDQQINFNKKRTDLPAGAQEVLYKIRDGINNAMNEAINSIQGVGADQLKKLNREYSKLSRMDEMAAERIAMNAANRTIGLTDSIAGGAGFAAGFASGDGLEDRLKRGAVGLGLGLVNKGGRTFGSGLQAAGFRKASQGLNRASALADFISRNSAGVQTVANRVTQPAKFTNPEVDPILDNPAIMGKFRENPSLIDAVDDPRLREAILKRIGSQQAPERGVSSQ